MLNPGYVVTERVVGIIRQEKVRSVDMPHARFLEVVEETIANKYPTDGDYAWPAEEVAALRKEITPVVEAMERFPLSSWMTTRGCGCVIGEYVVATSELERAEINARLSASTNPGGTSISELLKENPHKGILFSFGYSIDQAMFDEIGASWIDKIENVEFIR